MEDHNTNKDYEFEERAAILEYDGGKTREHAEYQAKIEIIRRAMKSNTKSFGV